MLVDSSTSCKFIGPFFDTVHLLSLSMDLVIKFSNYVILNIFFPQGSCLVNISITLIIGCINIASFIAMKIRYMHLLISLSLYFVFLTMSIET